MPSPTSGHLAANLAAHRQRWGTAPEPVAADVLRMAHDPWPQVSIRGESGAWVRLDDGRPPDLEAAAWIERNAPALAPALLTCVVGLGLGDVVTQIAARWPDHSILALEPEPALLTLAMERHDWTALIADGRLMLLAGPGYEGRAGAWRLATRPAEAPSVLVHPVAARERGAATRAAAKVIGQALAGARANAQARARFAAPYLRNTLRNLRHFVHARDVRACAGRHAGRPAIVAAAGPSLNRNLGELAALSGWRDHAVVVAVDTALKPMLAVDMAPHYVVGVDPGDANAPTLSGLPPVPETWLIAEASLAPACFAAFHDRTAIFRVSDTHAPWPWLAQHGVQVGQLRAWGSVLTTAFDFAVQAGCDPIIFIGVDLAYTGGQPYCRDTVYEERWAAAVAAGASLAEVWQRQMATAELVEVTDVHGRPGHSSATLVAFRDWLAAHAPGDGRRIVNATGAGILAAPGIEQTTLAAALAPGRAQRHRGAIGPADAPPVATPARLDEALGALIATAVTPPPAPLDGWETFTNGSVTTADVVAAALDAWPVLGTDPGLRQRVDAYAARICRDAAAWSRYPADLPAGDGGASHWRTSSPGDWAFGPIAAESVPPGPMQAFRTHHALTLNARRLEHLATLGLPLRQRRVLEVGAGVGDLTDFFLDRGCTVQVTDARADHVAVLARRFARHPLVGVAALDLDPPPPVAHATYDIVFCYGVLYHVGAPREALDYLAASCDDLLILESAVGPNDAVDGHAVEEDPAAAGAAVSGRGCRPARAWLWQQLRARFAHVYVALTQPNHYEFPLDWARPSPFLRRAVFIASRRPLASPLLSPECLDRQQRH